MVATKTCEKCGGKGLDEMPLMVKDHTTGEMVQRIDASGKPMVFHSQCEACGGSGVVSA